jgi:endonuclease/exonuclease/phosphatase (EEP) superfamily protein YafD
MRRPSRNRFLVCCEWIAAAIAVLAGLAALSRFGVRPWPLELLSHFQTQYLLVATLAAVLLVARRRWRLSAIALACAAVAATAVVPLSWRSGGGAAYASTVSSRGHMRVLHANVLSWNRRYDDVLALVEAEDPDVVVLQEVTRRWMKAMEGLADEYPYQLSGPREDNVAIAVFSRLPFARHARHELGGAGLPTLTATVLADGRPVSLLVTHPKPPVEHWQFDLRNDQLEEVRALARSMPRPLVVVGDLNTTMWSPWYRDFCGPNELANAREGFGVLPSWPVQYPPVARLPIDHCLVSPQITVTGCRLGPAIGSDHLPLIVDLVVP